MAVDHVKSATITNLDASPIVANTAGEGAGAPLKIIDATATMVASSSVDATYQFVRVASTAKVKKIWFESAAQTSGALSVGLYYATDGEGGKPTALLASNAISQAYFASTVTVTAAVAITEITNSSGSYTADKRVQPIWQAVGLTSDPGGYFDIVGTVTVATTTGAGLMGLTVQYTD